jgi:hypothetical protein
VSVVVAVPSCGSAAKRRTPEVVLQAGQVSMPVVGVRVEVGNIGLLGVSESA